MVVVAVVAVVAVVVVVAIEVELLDVAEKSGIRPKV